MPSEKPARRLLDIVENCEAIARYTEGMDRIAFERNSLVCGAVERCLERINEAVAKLATTPRYFSPTNRGTRSERSETSCDMNMTT